MLHRQTQHYLKNNQIKSTSFYNKSFYRSVKPSFLSNDKYISTINNTGLHLQTKLSIDIYKNSSSIVEYKSNSVELGKVREPCLSFYRTGRDKGCANNKNGHSIINSERTSRSEILKQIQASKKKPQVTQTLNDQLRTRKALQKLKNEIIFENQLLQKQPTNEYFPKIKLTKRKFKLPKTKQLSQYCPWIIQTQDFEDSDDCFNLNNK